MKKRDPYFGKRLVCLEVLEALRKLPHQEEMVALEVDLERLATASVSENGCWQCNVVDTTTGYGKIQVNRKTFYKHRFVYVLANGSIPSGFQIDHICRNRGCINPKHLEAVTQRENIIRGNGWAGIHARKTTCPKGHQYNSVLTNRGRRRCGECGRIYAREYWRKNHAG